MKILKQVKKKLPNETISVKEYQNRWYIVGSSRDLMNLNIWDGPERLELLTIHLNLIQNLILQGFENIMGLTYSNDEPEEVTLSFTSLQGKYIKALPLHRSQEIIKKRKKKY